MADVSAETWVGGFPVLKDRGYAIHSWSRPLNHGAFRVASREIGTGGAISREFARVGRARWRSGPDIFEIGEDYILGQSWDEMYVEYVQVWPLER